MKHIFILAAVFALIGASTAMAGTADVVFLVDESGSMGGEHTWLGNMISSLDTALTAESSIDSTRYALVGFGSSTHSTTYQSAHKHTIGTGDWGTAAQFKTATGGLTTSGGFEDGWQAMDFAMNKYTFTGDAINFILVTDEDRDYSQYAPGASLTYSGVLAALKKKGIVLNAVVNAYLYDEDSDRAIGVTDLKDTYHADGQGGYTTDTGGYVSWGSGTTEDDYIDMAWATGGAAWDLNQLRAGGNTAKSFTAAFVDHKVEEIVTQAIPLPAGAWMGLALLGGLGVVRRIRRRRAA